MQNILTEKAHFGSIKYKYTPLKFLTVEAEAQAKSRNTNAEADVVIPNSG